MPQDIPNLVKFKNQELRIREERKYIDNVYFCVINRSALIDKFNSSYISENIDDFYVTFRNINAESNLNLIKRTFDHLTSYYESRYSITFNFQLSNDATQKVISNFNSLKYNTEIKIEKKIYPDPVTSNHTGYKDPKDSMTMGEHLEKVGLNPRGHTGSSQYDSTSRSYDLNSNTWEYYTANGACVRVVNGREVD